MLPLPPDWPGHILRGPMGPKVVLTGLSGLGWRPVCASQDPSGAARTTSGHYCYELVQYFRTPFSKNNVLLKRESKIFLDKIRFSKAIKFPVFCIAIMYEIVNLSVFPTNDFCELK